MDPVFRVLVLLLVRKRVPPEGDDVVRVGGAERGQVSPGRVRPS